MEMNGHQHQQVEAAPAPPLAESSSSPDGHEDSQIIGIMFCEFHDKEGPKIVVQKPTNLISKEVFECTHPYIIPKVQLKNRLLTITVGKYRICGYPIYIFDEKYPRNQYIFNVCFIFNHNKNCCSYEAVVKKLATDLKTLEVESEFLTMPVTKAYLPELIEQIRMNLNEHGECVIQKIRNIEYSSLFLKLIVNHNDPQRVQSFDVPVFTVNFKNFQIDDQDLTTQIIVSSINGFKTVSMIAKETNIAIDIVKRSIQNLLYADVIMLIPVIQFSSMFVKTPRIAEFYTNHELHVECIKFVKLDPEAEAPSFYDVFFFMNQFNHGVTVQDIFQTSNPVEKNIDLKKLILYGLIKGYFRKTNKYPSNIVEPANRTEDPLKYLIGSSNLDKICSVLSCSVKHVEEKLDEDPNVVIYIK